MKTRKPQSSTLRDGDAVAYAASFPKNTGQFTGSAPQRRGVFLGFSRIPGFVRVRWSDEAETLRNHADAEYCDEVRRNGSLVATCNIARVGSARFALNDL